VTADVSELASIRSKHCECPTVPNSCPCLPSFLLSPLFSPSIPRRASAPEIQLGSLGSAVRFPSELWSQEIRLHVPKARWKFSWGSKPLTITRPKFCEDPAREILRGIDTVGKSWCCRWVSTLLLCIAQTPLVRFVAQQIPNNSKSNQWTLSLFVRSAPVRIVLSRHCKNYQLNYCWNDLPSKNSKCFICYFTYDKYRKRPFRVCCHTRVCDNNFILHNTFICYFYDLHIVIRLMLICYRRNGADCTV